MKLSPKSRRNLQKIIPFGVIWLITAWVFLLVESAATDYENLKPDEVITLTPEVFLFASISVTLVGLLVGITEVIIFGKKLDHFSLTKKVALKFSIYLAFILVMITILFPIAGAIELGKSPLSEEVLKKYQNYISGTAFLSNLVQISFSLILSLLYQAISDNLGHNVLLNFFSGKYHKPIREERIFMFLDMRSSTSIAEELGHVRYFELLKQYYDAMSDAIIQHQGEVYQYIGDELVVSWSPEKGLKNGHCLRCFFSIQESFQKQAEKFNDRFGLVPEFKAGMHLGEVTTGEIGALKKEIVFTGDILNTTSRIQSLCNELKADLLISGDLHAHFRHSNEFHFQELGAVDLKGKTEKMSLFRVER